jgi:hypothetical protein
MGPLEKKAIFPQEKAILCVYKYELGGVRRDAGV